jgi:hypothetical protein
MMSCHSLHRAAAALSWTGVSYPSMCQLVHTVCKHCPVFQIRYRQRHSDEQLQFPRLPFQEDDDDIEIPEGAFAALQQHAGIVPPISHALRIAAADAQIAREGLLGARPRSTQTDEAPASLVAPSRDINTTSCKEDKAAQVDQEAASEAGPSNVRTEQQQTGEQDDIDEEPVPLSNPELAGTSEFTSLQSQGPPDVLACSADLASKQCRMM